MGVASIVVPNVRGYLRRNRAPGVLNAKQLDWHNILKYKSYWRSYPWYYKVFAVLFAPLLRGGAVWQLVGLITRRSQVQILPPLPDLTAAPDIGAFLYGFFWLDKEELFGRSWNYWLYFAGVIRRDSEKWAHGPFFVLGICISKIKI